MNYNNFEYQSCNAFCDDTRFLVNCWTKSRTSKGNNRTCTSPPGIYHPLEWLDDMTRRIIKKKSDESFWWQAFINAYKHILTSTDICSKKTLSSADCICSRFVAMHTANTNGRETKWMEWSVLFIFIVYIRFVGKYDKYQLPIVLVLF